VHAIQLLEHAEGHGW